MKRELYKAIFILLMIAAAFFAAVVWANDRPDETTWVLRVVSTAVSIIALVLLLKLQYKRALVPDFLLVHSGDYYSRQGLCFMPGIEVVDGVATFQIWFQNQYERPCRAQIALQAGPGFCMNLPNVDKVVFDIECEAGAFGVQSIPLLITRKLQGECLIFDIGATVNFPDSRGKQLRFRDGIVISKSYKFQDITGVALGTVSFLAGGGRIGMLGSIFSKPKHVKLRLPTGELEELPTNIESRTTKTYWRLGDDANLEW